MKLKDIYCEFRQNGEILVAQGLKRKEEYVSCYHIAFENFKKTLEFYNFGKELEINEFKKIEKKHNKIFGIKNTENYFEKIYKENLVLMSCILKFNENNFCLEKEKINNFKKNINLYKKELILEIWKNHLKKTNSDYVFKISNFDILKEKIFLKKAKRIKKNIFGCFTMKELELKYGIKGNKKIFLYKKREKECYLKELKRDFIFLIDKKDFTIKKGNLEFLIDGYSTDLDFCFYEYLIKNRKE